MLSTMTADSSLFLMNFVFLTGGVVIYIEEVDTYWEVGAGYESPQPHLLLPVYQKVVFPLTEGGWNSDFGKFGVDLIKLLN